MKPELSENKAPKIIQILLDTDESRHWGGSLIGLGDDGALYVLMNGVKRWMVYMPPLHKDDAALTSQNSNKGSDKITTPTIMNTGLRTRPFLKK